MIAPAHGVPLRDLLALDGFAEVAVLAGTSTLDRVVSGISVMDGVASLEPTRAHELVVAYAVPATHEAGQLVRRLHERDVVGLMFRPERRDQPMDPEVLALADELGFAILVVPAALSVEDLVQRAFALLNEVQAAALNRIDALHTALTLIVLEGGDLAQIAAEVARVLDVGVLVTSTDGRVRAEALPEDLRAPLSAAELFDETGRFRVERVSGDPVAVAGGHVAMQPIVAGGTDLARLVCYRPGSPLPLEDVSALQRAATVAALLLTRQEAVTAVENKYRGDFLRDVFLGRAGDEAYVVEHAEALGWNLTRPMLVLSAELDPAPASDGPATSRVRRGWQERFSAAWRQVCASYDASVPTVDFSSEVVVLLPAPDGATGAALETSMHAAVRQIVTAVRGDKGGGRRPFSVGVSRAAGSLVDLPDAYAQARRAAEVGRRVHGGGGTTWFDQLGIHRLIALVPDPAELTEFAEDVLGELAKDTNEAADLRVTLQVLLDTNFNVAEAARLQFFHYNTMRYRVSKLERMLGPIASDPHLRLDVAVALKVLEIRP